jgi:Rieske Fe-S protein
MTNQPLTRRKFFEWGSGIIAGFIGLAISIPLVGSFLTPLFKKPEEKWVDIGLVMLLRGNRFKKVDYEYLYQDGWIKANKKRSVYVTHLERDEFIVFSRTCTHLGCNVRWIGEKEQFQCPCHGGIYDAQGGVIGGPPPKPLTHLQTKVEDGILYVKEV